MINGCTEELMGEPNKLFCTVIKIVTFLIWLIPEINTAINVFLLTLWIKTKNNETKSCPNSLPSFGKVG